MFPPSYQKGEFEMNRNIKIFFAAILVAVVFTQEQICEHLGFGQAAHHERINMPVEVKEKKEVPEVLSPNPSDHFVDDQVYHWDEQELDWVPVKKNQEFQAKMVEYPSPASPSAKPIEVDWKVLMDIQYKLKYFDEIEMEMYAPVFSDAVNALHGQKVTIEGFVIPFEEEGDLVSLSFNPYASCFFCGKASPASVISMYLKSKRNSYKIDDYKKFSGTLFLNHDDPNEFYYILRDAKEVK